jgi:hypothetical protein
LRQLRRIHRHRDGGWRNRWRNARYSRNSTMVAPAPPSCCGAG